MADYMGEPLIDLSLIDLNTTVTADYSGTPLVLFPKDTSRTAEYQGEPLIYLNHKPEEPEDETSFTNLNDRKIMFSIDLNNIPEEAVPEEENILVNNEPVEIITNEDAPHDIDHDAEGYHNDFGFEPDVVVFTGESTLPLLPQGQRRGHAPIPACVKLQKRPEWLPLGWWIDYRVRPRSNAHHIYIYKSYVDPVSGRKFRSKREVDKYLHPEIMLEGENARAANLAWPRFSELTWGRKRKRSGIA